jgi:metal-responsive CopG/Arc/MetJ family transcriptional regulator
MKTIQITMDERLLSKLDADEETRRDGRSAVLRRAAAEYLKARQRSRIDEAYQRAYKEAQDVDREFEGWQDEATWPNE